jgi:hypothetical protein
MPRGSQPGLDLGLRRTYDEHPGLAPTDRFTTRHAPNPKGGQSPFRNESPRKTQNGPSEGPREDKEGQSLFRKTQPPKVVVYVAPEPPVGAPAAMPMPM